MRRLVLVLLIGACSVDHTGLGPDIDANVVACTTPEDCDRGEPCTTYACDDGMCRETGCGIGLMCDGTSCVPRSSCDPDLCRSEGANPLRCAEGQCQGDACASVSTCVEGELCCGNGCAACDPLPDMPCVRHVCDGDVCGTEPLAAGTACFVDGDFCLGRGTCNGAGVCADAVTCERDCLAGRCVGCKTDDGCPDLVEGDDCESTLGVNDCASSVVQIRTVYTCQDNECVMVGEPTPDPRIECRRPDGYTCSNTIVGPPSACEYAAACSQTGRSGRTITDHVCEAGACTPESRTEDVSAMCNRSTNGVACPTTPTPPIRGMCTGFGGICGETGMRTVQPFVSVCAGGGCNPNSMGTSFMEACTRDQAGVECMPTTYTNWSPCEQSGTSCSGSRTRIRRDFACAGGGCVMTNTTETDNSCQVEDLTDCGTLGATCEEDTPENTMSCIGRRRRPTCMGGTCRTNRFVECDLVGPVCDSPVTSTCVASVVGGFNTCTGQQTVTTYTCTAGRECSPTVGMSTTCDVDDDNPCGDPSMCEQGTCDGSGTCEPAVDCGSNGACGLIPIDCLLTGETCGCDGAGGCECGGGSGGGD